MVGILCPTKRVGAHRAREFPQYDPYEDETQNKKTFPQLAEELEPTPEVSDHYIGAEILLPRGDDVARGHVMAQSCNTSGDIMGRAHMNTNLDTRMYQVEFAISKVTELTINVIAESMYAQNNADGNKYLLLDVQIGYGKDKKTISLTNQQTTI